MFYVRESERGDLEAMVAALSEAEGYSSSPDEQTPDGRSSSTRASLEAFASTSNGHGLVVCDSPDEEVVGFILFRYHNRRSDTLPSDSILGQLPLELFPPSGNFCEVFELWVAASHRRLGLATLLKHEMERHMQDRGVRMVYTHTEQSNGHIIRFNQRLGYRAIRTGPIWDEVVRVSLIKHLHPEACPPKP